MPGLTDEAKRDLLDEQLGNRNALDLWVLLGGLVYPLTAAVAHAPSALCALMAYCLKRKNNGIDRALQDPPRDDFFVPTRARRRQFFRDELPPGELEHKTANFVDAQLYAAAYLEAAVRADERAWGARLAGRMDIADRRLDEAKRFTSRARNAQPRVAREAVRVARAWVAAYRGQYDCAPPTDLRPGRRVDVMRAMDPTSREILRRTGVTIHDVDLVVTVSDPETVANFVERPVETTAAATEAAGRDARRSAEGLSSRKDSGPYDPTRD